MSSLKVARWQADSNIMHKPVLVLQTLSAAPDEHRWANMQSLVGQLGQLLSHLTVCLEAHEEDARSCLPIQSNGPLPAQWDLMLQCEPA